MDGRPVDEGQITFFPTGDTAGPAAGGPIELGRYEIKQISGPTVGENLVEILAYKKTGPPQTQSFGKNRPNTPEEMYKIWGKRPIFFEPEGSMEVVIESGKNEFDFPLKETKNE